MAQLIRRRRHVLVRLVAVFSLTCLLKLIYDMHVYDVDSKNTVQSTTFPNAVFSTARTSSLPPPPSTEGPVTSFARRYRHVDTYSKPRGVQTHNGVWQAVDADVYLFSAFYDNRPGLEAPMIRTIAVSKYVSDSELRCLLWFSNTARPLVTKATASAVGAWFDIGGHGMFCAVILSCAVRANTGHPAPIPEHVSIMTIRQTAPMTLLRVQVPEKPEHPILFGHCMSVVYWRHDPYRIVEWMELHRMWGVEEVTIYNSSLLPKAARVYEHYAKKGFVDFRQAPLAVDANRNDEQAILLNMSPVLNDCMYRNLYRYRRLVITDIDEMIVPRIHDNYTAMLEAIEEAYEQTNGQSTTSGVKTTRPSFLSQPYRILAKPKKVLLPASYLFNNVYFFSDFNATNSAPWFLNTQRYFQHVEPSEPGYSVKTIYNPRECVGVQNHYCWVPLNKNTTLYAGVPLSVGMNYHYKKCHFDVYLNKPGHCKQLMKESSVDHTMARFRRRLESRVRVVLKELNIDTLSPRDS